MSEHDGGPMFPLKNYTSEIGPDNCGFMATDIVGTKVWVNSGSPGMSQLVWLAAQAPEPDKDWVNNERQKDANANPHGDSHKPCRRDSLELRIAWRYKWARMLLAEAERQDG